MAVDELITVLGLEGAEKTLAQIKAVSEGISKVEKFCFKLAATLTITDTLLGTWITLTSRGAQSLLNFSQMTGVSTDDVQALSYATEQLGGSSESLKSNIMALRKEFGSYRDINDIFDTLADTLSKMDTGMALVYGSKLGLSEDTIRLLMRGRDGIKALKEQAKGMGGIVSYEALQNSVKFNQGLKNIWFSLKGISSTIGLSLLPHLTAMLDKWTKWTVENQKWIALKIDNGLKFVTDNIQFLTIALGVGVGAWASWKIASMAAVLGVNSLYILGIATALALIALAIDDLISMSKGNKSIFGPLFEGIYNWIEKIKGAIGMTTDKELTIKQRVKTADITKEPWYEKFIEPPIVRAFKAGRIIELRKDVRQLKPGASIDNKSVPAVPEQEFPREQTIAEKAYLARPHIENHFNFNIHGAGDPNQVSQNIVQKLRTYINYDPTARGMGAPVASK
jgi:hypothetical protein